MERFAQFVVGGGLALVAGLWLRELSAAASPASILGAALAALGAGGLLLGIRSEVDLG